MIGGMSDHKDRIPLAEAEALARRVVEILAPACERIEVAGSIRRRRKDVGDIEIVCIPKFAPGEPDMFGDPTAPVNLQFQLMNRLEAEGVFRDRLSSVGLRARGEKFQRMIFDGFACDIFCVTPETWGVQFLLRTGPADFNKRFVLQRGLGGTILKLGQRIEDGRLIDRGVALDTPEERDVFAAVGLPWINPEDRA